MSALSLSWLLVALSCFFYLIFHVVCFRILRPKKRTAFLVLLFLITAISLSFVSNFLYGLITEPSHNILKLFTAFSFFLFSFGMSMIVYSVIDHAVRIRIALEIESHLGGQIKASDLFLKYRPELMTYQRLEELKRGGYLVEENTYLKLTPKGYRFARFGTWGLRFFKID